MTSGESPEKRSFVEPKKIKHYTEQFKDDDEYSIARVTFSVTVPFLVRHEHWRTLGDTGAIPTPTAPSHYRALVEDIERFHRPTLSLNHAHTDRTGYHYDPEVVKVEVDSRPIVTFETPITLASKDEEEDDDE